MERARSRVSDINKYVGKETNRLTRRRHWRSFSTMPTIDVRTKPLSIRDFIHPFVFFFKTR